MRNCWQLYTIANDFGKFDKFGFYVIYHISLVITYK